MKLLICLLLMLGVSNGYAAQQILPLQRGSFKKIISAHAGKPFIVAMWSVSCTHCGADLEIFNRLLRKHAEFDLVLIATDVPEQEEFIVATLNKYKLLQTEKQGYPGKVESWVFADSFTERLHFEVDPKWYGELPRTYFFDAMGKAKGVSGVLDAREIEQWLSIQQ